MSILTVPSPRVTNPNICHRRSWHDYSRPGVYAVTLVRHPEVTRFSEFRETAPSAEGRPEVELLPNGMHINRAFASLQSRFEGVSVLAKAIMPDYASFIVRNEAQSGTTLDDILFKLKQEANERYLGLDTEWEEVHSPDYVSSLFDGGFDDRVVLTDSEVERFVVQIERAPTDFLYLRRHFDFNHRFRFTTAEGRTFEGYGNALLLTDPGISAVRISSKYTEEELRSRKQEWFRTIFNGGVLVSPFVSGAEAKVRNYALEHGGRVIILLPNGFGPTVSLRPEWEHPLKSGRLLLIAPSEFTPGLTRPDRTLCLQMNDTATLIATHRLL